MPDEIAARFMTELAASLNVNDKLFLGADLIKSRDVVLPAYSDNEGFTRDFNLNLLSRINRELGGDFNIDDFSHQPEYDESDGIAKSFLVSDIQQTVFIDKMNKSFHFEKGEKIATEISRKYNDEIIQLLIKETTFTIIAKLTDSKNYFSNYILNLK